MKFLLRFEEDILYFLESDEHKSRSELLGVFAGAAGRAAVQQANFFPTRYYCAKNFNDRTSSPIEYAMFQ